MPPLPAGALEGGDAPGLHITYATDDFLLATKLVAQRRKDAADIITLAKRLGMENATADDLEQVISRYYTDEASLEFIIDGKDIDREIQLLTSRAAHLLASHQSASTPATPADNSKPRPGYHRARGTSRERD